MIVALQEPSVLIVCAAAAEELVLEVVEVLEVEVAGLVVVVLVDVQFPEAGWQPVPQ